MREFEFTSGGSQKFWQIERDATSVTVRFGRIGTNGQTQVKDFGSEDAAIAHVDKLVAEKVKKGYVETASGSPPVARTQKIETPPEAEVVDEDTFVIPASWRRSILPRPGGVPGPAITVKGDPVEAAQGLIEYRAHFVELILTADRTDTAIAAAAEPYLTEGMATLRNPDATPLGAAALAVAIAQAVELNDGAKLTALADAWVATRGLAFAAQTVAEIGNLWVEAERSPKSYLRWLRDGDSSYGWVYRWASIVERTRHHVAAAGPDELARVRDALAGYRDGPLRQRLLTSFLLPGERDWVDADLAALPPNPPEYMVSFLLATVGSREQLDLVADKITAWWAGQSLGVLAALVEGVGPAVAPAVAAWFDDYSEAEHKKRFISVLAALPTDEAFSSLLDRLDQKYVQPAVLEAMGRYPVRALRLLSAAAGGQSASAKVAAELLRIHVVANPAVVEATLPSLPDAARQRVTAIVGAAASVAVAPPDVLPAVLVSPPWTATRSRAKPVVLDGLRRPQETAMAWLPGEREAWAAEADDRRTDGEWRQVAEQLRTDGLPHFERCLFMAGAPEALVRPLLADWKPSEYWYVQRYLGLIVARFELDALPVVLHLARLSGTSVGESVLPYAASEVADVVADWLIRLKSLRDTALSWLNRHAAVAARALIPAALGKAGPARRAAENAIRTLVAAGHESHVTDAAASYGPAAADAIKAFLAIDPLALLPARIPTVPDWADAALLPGVLLRDRSHVLPSSAVGHLCTILAMSKPGEPYAGLAAVQQACDPESLAEFGWALFQRWQSVGSPSKESWVLESLGSIGDDETVRRLAPVIRAWPGEGGHARAVTGLDVLANIGTDVALMHLNGIAEKVKFKGLKERAQEKLAQVAEDLGLTAAELADRLVPDLGLDADGSLTLDYGPRQFTVGFDEQLKPYVADADGKRLKDLPKPGTRDDADLAGAAYKRYVALKKDVRTLAADQIRRLEQAMVTGRRWSGRAFADLFVAHPLLWHIVRRLVWATFDAAGTPTGAVRVAEDRSYADASDDTYTLDDEATVGIAHPLHLGDTLAAWSEVFADYEILQPFPQLGRDVHALTDSERAAVTLDRFAGLTVPTTKVLGLERRGWRRGAPQDAGIQSWMEREVPGGRAIVIDIEPGIVVGMVTEFPEQKLDQIWLNDKPYGGWRRDLKLRFGDLDAVTASEMLRDLAEVTS